MITKFEDFLNENIEVGTPLRRYFSKNSLTHQNLIGKKVVTQDGDAFYIKQIEPIKDNTQLPFQILCSSKPDSHYGHYVNTDKLFIPDDIDFKIAQGQGQAQLVQSPVQTQTQIQN
jgi:hypothetical protein